MALDATALKTLIVSKVTTAIGAQNIEADGLDKFAEAIAEAVVEHIQTNAVTACPAGAGTVQ